MSTNPGWSNGLVLLIVHVATLHVSLASLVTDEASCLRDLYQTLDGSSWERQGGWSSASFQDDAWHINGTSDPCQFEGITCVTKASADADHMCTMVAELGTYVCEGVVAESIGVEEDVVIAKIDLHDNRLEGHLPNCLGSFTFLESFNMGISDLPLDDLDSRSVYKNPVSNNIQGELPTSMSSWSRLKMLQLRRNAFHGSLPDWLGQLSALEYFDITNNLFEGDIPSYSWPNLFFFDIHKNEGITGEFPAFLREAPNMRHIDISVSGLYGEIPEWIGELMSLETLVMDGSKLSGAIPSTIGNLKRLKNLTFGKYSPGISGQLPQELGDCTSLFFLYISTCNIEGPLPELKSVSLAYLYIEEVPGLTGEFPLWLNTKPFLSVIFITSTSISGSIDDSVISNVVKHQSVYDSTLMTMALAPTVEGELGEVAGIMSGSDNCGMLEDIDPSLHFICLACGALLPELGSPTMKDCVTEYTALEILSDTHSASRHALKAFLTLAYSDALAAAYSEVVAAGLVSEDDTSVSADGFSIPVVEAVCQVLSDNATCTACLEAQQLGLPETELLGDCYLRSDLPVAVDYKEEVDRVKITSEYVQALSEAYPSVNDVSMIPFESVCADATALSLLPVEFSTSCDPASESATCPEASSALSCAVDSAVDSLPDTGTLTNAALILRHDIHIAVVAGLSQLDAWIPTLTEGAYARAFDIPGGSVFCGALPDPSLAVACEACHDGVKFGVCMADESTYAYLPFLTFFDINLNNNKLEGPLPPSIGNLPTLVTLKAQGNSFEGSIPEFSNSEALQSIDLGGNQLTGPLPSSLCNIPNLVSLVVRSNQLSGTIPTCVGGMSELKTLILSSNELEGELPREIGQMTTLVQLKLDDNRLTGAIPAELGDMTALQVLDLSTNSLDQKMANLVPVIVRLDNLVKISIANNKFAGDLDSTQFYDLDTGLQMKNVIEFNLAGNQITGPCPNFMSLFDSLSDLDISNNELSGACDADGFRAFDNWRIHGNDGLASGDGFSIPDFIEIVPNAYITHSGPEGYADVDIECPTFRGKYSPMTAQLDPSYYGYSLCRCKNGYFGSNGQCRPCLENGICTSGSTLVVAPGFFPEPSTDNPSLLVECYETGRGTTACNPHGEGAFTCEVGYEGRLCSKCSEGFYERSRTCLECPDTLPYILLIVFIGIVVGVYIALILRVVPVMDSMVILSSFLDYLQGTSILLNQPAFKWTSAIESLGGVLQYSTVQMSVFQCLDKEGFNAVNTTIYLFIGPMVFGCISTVIYLSGKISFRRSASFWGRHCAAPLVNFLNFMYLPILSRALRNVRCDTDPYSGNDFMVASPDTPCDLDGDYQIILINCVIALVAYGIGVPSLQAAILYRIRDKLEQESTDALCYNIIRPYKRELYWFRLPTFVRRLMLILTLTVFGTNSAAPFFLFLVISISIFVQVYFQPFRKRLNNSLETLQLSVLMFTFVCGLTFSSEELSNHAEILEVVLILAHVFTFSLFVGYASLTVWRASRRSQVIKLEDHELSPTKDVEKSPETFSSRSKSLSSDWTPTNFLVQLAAKFSSSGSAAITELGEDEQQALRLLCSHIASNQSSDNSAVSLEDGNTVVSTV